MLAPLSSELAPGVHQGLFSPPRCVGVSFQPYPEIHHIGTLSSDGEDGGWQSQVCHVYHGELQWSSTMIRFEKALETLELSNNTLLTSGAELEKHHK